MMIYYGLSKPEDLGTYPDRECVRALIRTLSFLYNPKDEIDYPVYVIVEKEGEEILSMFFGSGDNSLEEEYKEKAISKILSRVIDQDEYGEEETDLDKVAMAIRSEIGPNIIVTCIGFPDDKLNIFFELIFTLDLAHRKPKVKWKILKEICQLHSTEDILFLANVGEHYFRWSASEWKREKRKKKNKNPGKAKTSKES